MTTFTETLTDILLDPMLIIVVGSAAIVCTVAIAFILLT